jgi:sec-independent protein translocase protein TatB
LRWISLRPPFSGLEEGGWQLSPYFGHERMFGIGLPELLIILAVALIVVGPEKLPELARSLAKGMMELKKTANSLRNSIQEEVQEVKEELKPWEQLPPGQPPSTGPSPDMTGSVSQTEEEASLEEQKERVILPAEVERDRRSAKRPEDNGKDAP